MHLAVVALLLLLHLLMPLLPLLLLTQLLVTMQRWSPLSTTPLAHAPPVCPLRRRTVHEMTACSSWLETLGPRHRHHHRHRHHRWSTPAALAACPATGAAQQQATAPESLAWETIEWATRHHH
jgi:hypothetical protein